MRPLPWISRRPFRAGEICVSKAICRTGNSSSNRFPARAWTKPLKCCRATLWQGGTLKGNRLLRFWYVRTHNSAAFADRQDLIGLHLGETFDFLRRRPSHFDEIHGLKFSQAEVQAQVALRHHAGATVDFVHLRMLACYDADAGADGGAVAFCANKLDLDPILQAASIVAKKRRRVVHIQHERVHVAVVIVIAEGRAPAGESLADAGAHCR